MTQKIIFDCDNTLGLPLKEVDDGLTLLYLLGVPDIEIMGVTTTFGNGSIDQVFNQTKKLVKPLNADIPVYRGEGHPGDKPDTPAAHFLVETVDRSPGEITLLATGPLGNLHAASLLDPEFFAKTKRIVCMGGYLQPLKLGYRNLHELNFSADPEAALAVLNAPCPVTVFPGSACLDAPYSLKDIWSSKVWSTKMKLILTQWLLAFGLFCGVNVFYLWDLLPAVFLTDPDLFEIVDIYFGSTLDDLKDGMLVTGKSFEASMVSICKAIKDKEGFRMHLENAWRSTLKKHPH